MDKHEAANKEITLRSGAERYLSVKATILKDGDGMERGVVLVLNDITPLKNLETVRKDFVANVSHEIKTPITAIKGFVETLQEGGMEDLEQAPRFLAIIERQVLRLEAIVEDLLSLSRLEQDAERGTLRFQKGRVSDVLTSASQICELKAADKNIKLEVSCPDDLLARMDSSLLEQAVVNLLDNAIKYSEKGKEVRVEGCQNGMEAVISVSDKGCGIAKEHLPRIFERFYRVDKARSRDNGGTGLGLAIVKHIIQAHSGRLSVESTPGEGSIFNIHLPLE